MKLSIKKWRTTTGATIAITFGGYLVLSGKNVEGGMGFVSLGLMGFGLGKKIDRTIGDQ